MVAAEIIDELTSARAAAVAAGAAPRGKIVREAEHMAQTGRREMALASLRDQCDVLETVSEEEVGLIVELQQALKVRAPWILPILPANMAIYCIDKVIA
eukprot:SAG31_NODE_1101_length_9905_cov_3.367122_2_plen_99_part_00